MMVNMGDVEYKMNEEFGRVKKYGFFFLVRWSFRQEYFKDTEEFFGNVRGLPRVQAVYGGRIKEKRRGWPAQYFGVLRFDGRGAKSITQDMHLVRVNPDGGKVNEDQMEIVLWVPGFQGGGQASLNTRQRWCDEVSKRCRDVVGDCQSIMAETDVKKRKEARIVRNEMEGGDSIRAEMLDGYTRERGQDEGRSLGNEITVSS